jgi:PadR family transcriptional regulator PadR
LAVVVSYKIGATQEGGAQMQGISSDVIRGYNDTMILYLLIQNPSYGYEITKQIKRMTDEKYIIKVFLGRNQWKKAHLLPDYGGRDCLLQGKMRGVASDKGSGREVYYER